MACAGVLGKHKRTAETVVLEAISKRAATKQREAAANAEISRLKLELAILRGRGVPWILGTGAETRGGVAHPA